MTDRIRLRDASIKLEPCLITVQMLNEIYNDPNSFKCERTNTEITIPYTTSEEGIVSISMTMEALKDLVWMFNNQTGICARPMDLEELEELNT